MIKACSRARITRALEDALKRLQTDTTDADHAHCGDERLSLGKILEAFAFLIESGEVCAISMEDPHRPAPVRAG